jgi:Spy/CpxP family protein refolding chaperone
MTWFKTTGAAISAALLAALAIFAAANAKQQASSARKWQQKADDIESGKVKESTLTAAAASTKAKLHDARAQELKAKAENRITQIGEKDEEISDILDRWSKS